MVTMESAFRAVYQAKDTMSATMKLAKEFHETDVGQPTAACPKRKLVTTRKPTPTRTGRSRRHRGACLRHGDTDDAFPRQARHVVESNAFLFSLDQPTAKDSYMERSFRLTPGLRKSRTAMLPREACFDQVTFAEEGHDADRRCDSTLSRTRGQLMKLAKEFHELDFGGE